MKKIMHILSVFAAALMATSCAQEIEGDGQTGFLKLKADVVQATQSRAAAPADYNAKTLHVEIRNSKGTVVKSTDNFGSDPAFQGNMEIPADNYTIVAHSAKWDGQGSGFDTPYYYGETTIQVAPKTLSTAKLVCTQANVKVTVNYDPSFAEAFASATTRLTSALAGIQPLDFVMGQTTKSGYFPVGNLTASLTVTNKKGATHTMDRVFDKVKAREHYILNFKLAQEGQLGDGTGPGVQVEVDESTKTYSFTIEVPKKSAIALTTRGANAWSKFAYLSGAITSKTSNFQNSGVTMQWRKKGMPDWTEIPNAELTIDAKDNISATLKGLTASTTYEYRTRYVNGETQVVGEPVTFTTDAEVPLYNGGYEHWYDSGKIAYPNENGTSFWDTSNPGGATFIGSNTYATTNPVHGGSKAAYLESKWAIVKFAAASLYSGQFLNLIGTKGAKLKWGQPFTARPTALHGFMQYAPNNIDKTGSVPAGAPGAGEPDQCGMYIALLTEQLTVDNTNMSTFPDWYTDPRVIAYGALPDAQNVHSQGQWKEVNIPLVYNDVNKKPAYILVVFSSSKYGDYFHGGVGSKLIVDDFELIYGDTPSVK